MSKKIELVVNGRQLEVGGIKDYLGLSDIVRRNDWRDDWCDQDNVKSIITSDKFYNGYTVKIRKKVNKNIPAIYDFISSYDLQLFDDKGLVNNMLSTMQLSDMSEQEADYWIMAAQKLPPIGVY